MMANAQQRNGAVPTLDGKPLGPSYQFQLMFGQTVEYPKLIDWFFDNAHVPLILVLAVYLPAIYMGQKLMVHREPVKARLALMLWNSSLALFSIVGFCHVFPELWYSWHTFGFKHTICRNTIQHVQPAIYWMYLFTLSKVPELVDTIFLVLRKQKLLFLHVYHHASVAVFAWYLFAYAEGYNRWICSMNYGIHAVMYTYYALKAYPNLVSIPRWFSIILTSSQIAQMIMGIYVSLKAVQLNYNGEACTGNPIMSIISSIMYFSYLVLFTNFFYNAYISPAPRHPRETNRATGKKHD